MEIVCKAYDSFHNYNPPIPTRFLREMLGLILNENSFKFNGENYLQTHGTAMGTKMAVSFCYGTDFATTASVFYFFIFGVELQHSAIADSQLLSPLPSLAANSLYSL